MAEVHRLHLARPREDYALGVRRDAASRTARAGGLVMTLELSHGSPPGPL